MGILQIFDRKFYIGRHSCLNCQINTWVQKIMMNSWKQRSVGDTDQSLPMFAKWHTLSFAPDMPQTLVSRSGSEGGSKGVSNHRINQLEGWCPRTRKMIKSQITTDERQRQPEMANASNAGIFTRHWNGVRKSSARFLVAIKSSANIKAHFVENSVSGDRERED